MNLILREPLRSIRKAYLMDLVISEYEVSPEQLQAYDKKTENPLFARCMLTLLMHEEGFKMPEVGALMNRTRIAAYGIKKEANNLLTYHKDFKQTYLKLIQIITENED